MSVSGIDFGNLSMLIAQTSKGGVDVILNGASNRQNSTCVSIQGKERFIGDSAAAIARSNIQNTVSCMKLLIGRQFDSPDVQREIAKNGYNAVKLPHGGVGFNINYNDETIVMPVEHMMAMVLCLAKSISQGANNGVAIGDAVLAVPNWFGDAQRRAVLASCEIAGLNCLKVTNESTAVALSYGIFKSAKKMFSETEPTHVMFVDLGYSCSTVCIVDFVQENMRVRSSVCDPLLGGRDFDDAIIDFMISTFQTRTGNNVRGNKKAYLKMQAAAEKAKKILSPAGVTEANISVECLLDDKDLNMNLSRDELESRSAHLIARLEPLVLNALREAGLTREQLFEVEIVGGSSRINAVKRRLGEILGLDPSAMNYGLKTTMNSDEAVSRGCALQCAMLSPSVRVKPFNIVDKISHGIVAEFEADQTEGEEKSGFHSVPLFSRGDDYPHKDRRLTFRKHSDFVITLAYDAATRSVFPEGEGRLIARYLIKIPAEFQGRTNEVRVTFGLDKHYCVQLISAQLMEEIPGSAEEVPAPPAEAPTDGSTPPAPAHKKKHKKIELVTQSELFGLPREAIAATIEREAQMANQDRILRETADKRNELESYIYSMRSKLEGALSRFATPDEKSRLSTQLNEAEDWLYGDGFDSTKTLYTQKIADLRLVGDLIEKRATEEEHRPGVVDAFRKQLDLSKAFVANYGPQYEHVTEDERESIRKVIHSSEAWLFDTQAKQAALPPSSDPVLTSQLVHDKRTQLHNITNPIMNKPKPKPAPVPTPAPAPEAKPAAEEKKSDSDSKGEPSEGKPVQMEEAN